MTGSQTLATYTRFDRQLELEDEMVGCGIKRFEAMTSKLKTKGKESETAYGSILAKRLIEPIRNGIVAFIDDASSGRPGPKHSAVQFLMLLPAEVAAYLAVKNILDTISKKPTIQRVALSIANAIQDEVLMGRYKLADKTEHKVTMSRLRDSTSTRHKRTVARLMAKRVGVTSEWTETERLHLGKKLIEIVRETTGLVELKRHTVGSNDTPYFVEATEDTMNWIKKSSDALSFLAPAYMPTLVPPKPWTSPWSGGYWHPEHKRLTIVKTRNRNYLEELEGSNPVAVYSALNAMQETPWQVNKPVLEALRRAWKADMKIKGIPAAEKLEPRPKPHDIETNEDARKEWKRDAAMTYTAEGKRKAKRIQLDRTLALAGKFRDEAAIYFPHTMDFRGRAYAVPMFLNPQGADVTKALLTFADGKPLGDGVAAGWLAIHGANTYGNDKVSLEDRVEWAETNTAAIVSSAEDPFGEAFPFWTKADKPWQFLAFCYEWAGFQREGYGFVSCLPIAMDGSCNGLQHYSAALRDPVGGKAVNLVPSTMPADIYAEVAKVTLGYVEAFARPELSGSEKLSEVTSLFAKPMASWAEWGIDAQAMASRWLAFGIDRKITKRSVMTLPYGSQQRSCRDFIEEAMREKLEDGKPNVFRESKDKDGLFYAAFWLTPLVWHAIGEVVTAARTGMNWLKDCAKLAAAENLPIYWRTADGFQVMQAYPETASRRIKTHIDGAITFLSLREQSTEKLDRREQQQGIAPNWVHSQDATALRMFVNLARENGLKHFALIHDSYGTVAADVEMMGACLRRAFVNLYSDFDPLAEFRVDIHLLLSEKAESNLPPLPEKGTLDLSLVEEADFFFA